MKDNFYNKRRIGFLVCCFLVGCLIGLIPLFVLKKSQTYPNFVCPEEEAIHCAQWTSQPSKREPSKLLYAKSWGEGFDPNAIECMCFKPFRPEPIDKFYKVK